MADVIDRLVEQLNTIDGLTFYRDARMENEPEADYGVVRLKGETDSQWADGVQQEQAFGVSVNVYVKDERDEWLVTIQEILADFDLGYRLPARNYIQDIDAVEWEWTATMFGPLTWEEPDEEDDDGENDG